MFTPAMVAGHLGIPVDDKVVAATEASRSWVEQHRRSVTVRYMGADVLWCDPAVVKGATLYAGLVYQKRAAPQGFPGYDVDLASADLAGAMGDVYRLVGEDPVVA